jgi:hypothetical protein
MRFAVAEVQPDGWLQRTEIAFDTFEEAFEVAKRWGAFRGAAVGVASCADDTLVWRSDGGDLSLPFLGVRPPSTALPWPS